MRLALLAAALFFVAALAGCSNKDKDADFHYQCTGGIEIHADDHPSANTTADLAKFCPGASGPTTAQAPNKLPTVALKVTDDLGNATRVTLLNGNLTFDAAGSVDPDGNLTGIAVTIKDSNTTRTATLFDAKTKTFTPAKFKFDRPGVVNVTVAAVDDRAGFAVNVTHVYVNHAQALGEKSFMLAVPTMSPGATCSGITGDAIVDELYSNRYTFSVAAGATFVEATVTPGHPVEPAGSSAILASTMCDPAGEPISEGTYDLSLHSLAGTVFVESLDYYVFIENELPPGATAAVTVLVHYEPQPTEAETIAAGG